MAAVKTIEQILSSLEISSEELCGGWGEQAYFDADAPALTSTSPIDGSELAKIQTTSSESYNAIIDDAHRTFLRWRTVPAPERGLLVREIGETFRTHKDALGALVSLEMGKILPEGLGEIQEAIDIADFAVGLSRQLYGLTMHSERPGHRMYEQWHPLGVVGVISAFNFPAAVWAWNAMLAVVCGNAVVWKPSELTPVTALAMNTLCRRVAAKAGYPGLFSMVTSAGPEHGEAIAADRRIPLVSATGSCRMGRSVAQVVAGRLGKSLLELGGNNAVIVMDDADLSLVVPSLLFGMVGTAGQRCTSTRRVYLHKDIAPKVIESLVQAYEQVSIGNPLKDGTLMGPLIHEAAVSQFVAAVAAAKEQGGEVLCGGARAEGHDSDLYVQPTLIRARHDMPIVKEETFAPVAYLIEVDSLEQAIAYQNDVPQGLSSALFTTDIRRAEQFLSAEGSDCGIANINIGTSGAEIGGAFGGEKDTGGGRESGSDSWRQYMRRQTNTINYSTELPLAQGIDFSV